MKIPLAVRRIQAATLVDWTGGRHAEFDRMIKAVSDTRGVPSPPPPPPQIRARCDYPIAALIGGIALVSVVAYLAVHRPTQADPKPAPPVAKPAGGTPQPREKRVNPKDGLTYFAKQQ